MKTKKETLILVILVFFTFAIYFNNPSISGRQVAIKPGNPVVPSSADRCEDVDYTSESLQCVSRSSGIWYREGWWPGGMQEVKYNYQDYNALMLSATQELRSRQYYCRQPSSRADYECVPGKRKFSATISDDASSRTTTVEVCMTYECLERSRPNVREP